MVIKQCPVCGKAPLITHYELDYGYQIEVECKPLFRPAHLCVSVYCDYRSDTAKAVEEWNKKVSEIEKTHKE